MVHERSYHKEKILPYFVSRQICDIKPLDVLRWQIIMIEFHDENGMSYSPMYLKTIHNQLRAILNHAIKFYGLFENPAAIAGNMGKEKPREILIWTKKEYQRFLPQLMTVKHHLSPLKYFTGVGFAWANY